MKTEEVDWKEVENTFRRPPSLSGRQQPKVQRQMAEEEAGTDHNHSGPNPKCPMLLSHTIIQWPFPLLTPVISAVVFHFVPHTF
jgi:hypothetical protein